LIVVDPNQIKQVLLNLFHNAIMAMPMGGVITLKTSRELREGQNWLSVVVCDTGEWITPENLDRIFEPFFTTRPPGSGTGLGLSVSYGIISDHGGTIEVESNPGKGSCFTVYLPFEQESHA
jgi:two-component system NtrC family sensor kinase